MKVTWGWLQDWVELPATPEALAHALAMRGFPVVSLEKGGAPDWDPAPAPKHAPAIDYLAKDYESFRHTMIAAMMNFQLPPNSALRSAASSACGSSATDARSPVP